MENTSEKAPLIIIAGATGVGKTSLSVKLAKEINGEIISCDSMAVYKGLDIGTAKVRPEETGGVPHYLIDEVEPDFDFNIFEFQKRAKDYINLILSRGKIPIMVGGTGFYIQSVLYDIEFQDEDPDRKFRESLEKEALEKGPEFLYNRLLQVDPEAAKEIHPNNTKRVIRALEFNNKSGGLISEHNKVQRSKESPYNFAYFVLNRNRETMYKRIEKRVDKMMEDGLESEVKRLLSQGVRPDSIAMGGLGYKEIVAYLNGEYPLCEAVSKIKINTRHFAKRQITWFKREKEAVWVNYEDFSDDAGMLEYMKEYLKEKKIV